MIEESKYFSDEMEKYFNKELVMTTEDGADLQKSGKCWICDNDFANVKIINIETLHIYIVILTLNQTLKFLSHFKT